MSERERVKMTETVIFKAPKSLKEKLDAYCEKTGNNISNVVRQAIESQIISPNLTLSDLAEDLKTVKDTVEKIRRGNIHAVINAKSEDAKTTITLLRIYEFVAHVALALDETASRLDSRHKSIKGEIVPYQEGLRAESQRFEKALTQLEMLQDLCRKGKYDLVFEYFKKQK